MRRSTKRPRSCLVSPESSCSAFSETTEALPALAANYARFAPYLLPSAGISHRPIIWEYAGILIFIQFVTSPAYVGAQIAGPDGREFYAAGACVPLLA